MLLPHTKNYLIESLNKHSTSDVNSEFYKEVVGLMEAGGGAGTGMDASNPSKKKKPNEEESPIETDPTSYAAMYAAGKGLGALADTVDSLGVAGNLAGYAGAKLLKHIPGIENVPILGDAAKLVASGAVTPFPNLMGAALRNLSDVSGANWFDANFKNIGHAQNALAAQGAGKPFTPLIVPQREEPNPTDFSLQSKQNRAIQAAKNAERAKRYRSMGYNIP